MLIKKVNNESVEGKKELWKKYYISSLFICMQIFFTQVKCSVHHYRKWGLLPFFPLPRCQILTTHPLSTVLPYTIPPSSAVYLFCPEAFMHVQEQFQSSFYYEKSEKERGQNNEK